MPTVERASWALVVCGALAVQPALAEDTKGKWQFGFGVSYYATTDYIRSNSDVAVATTVAGEEGGLPTVTFVDPRPDQNMLNEPSARDNFKWDFNASYGLTRWLALEAAAGYMKTAVGNIEYYSVRRQKFIGGGTPSAGDPNRGISSTICGPTGNGPCYRYPGTSGGGSAIPANDFVPVGDLTEIPLQLSGLVRFRPESPLDPYIGLGVGYILTNLDTNDEFDQRAENIGGLNVTSSWGGEVDIGQTMGPGTKVAQAPGYTPTPLNAEVNDGFEYHVVGGVDYFFSDHMSMYFDARYVWSGTSIDITTNGAHQVRMSAFYPGRLQTFQVGSAGAPVYWEDRGFTNCRPDSPAGSCVQVACRHENGDPCVGDGLLATEDGNGNGTVDRNLGEGLGKLYFYPLGPNPNDPKGTWRAGDAREVYNCDPAQESCPWVQPPSQDPDFNTRANIDATPDTEDANLNRYADRYSLWGVDVCSLPDAASNPLCRPTDIVALPQYIWPGVGQRGCDLSLPPGTTPGEDHPEGCPRPGNLQDVSLGPADDTSDSHLIQGGEIKLGGFSIGIGFKFTF